MIRAYYSKFSPPPPADWKFGGEPYYPPESRALLARCQAPAATIPNLTIGGRLGEHMATKQSSAFWNHGTCRRAS